MNLTASAWPEGDWFVAQCLEVNVTSQGETPEDALHNLEEALELSFEPPTASLDTTYLSSPGRYPCPLMRGILRQAGLSVDEFEALT